MSHHPIHKHMHTHITKSNVKAAIRDDKAHMTYLKEDVDKDQKYGGKYKDENQTADEKHISKLAGDVKRDEKKEGLSRRSSETAAQEKKDLMRDNPVDKDASGERKEGVSIRDVAAGPVRPFFPAERVWEKAKKVYQAVDTPEERTAIKNKVTEAWKNIKGPRSTKVGN